MQGALRWSYVIAVAELAALVVVLLVLPGQYWLLAVVVIAGLALNVLLLRRGIMGDRAAVARLTASHPGSTVQATSLTGDPGLPRADRGRVIALVADRGGISLRDRDDAEVLNVPASSILSLELAPLAGRYRARPVVVTRIDGPPVGLFAGPGPDQQLDTVVALRTALGRPLG